MAIDRTSTPIGKLTAAVLLAALTAACTAVPKPQPRPLPVPVTVPTPLPRPAPAPAPQDWRDAPQTSGNWTWSIVGGNSEASFGTSPQQPLFRISCPAGKGAIILSRAGVATTNDQFVITTTSLSRPLQIAPGSDSGLTGLVTTSISPRDPLLDAMAFSRGRFRVEVAKLLPIYLPSWPEVSRVIEDCR